MIRETEESLHLKIENAIYELMEKSESTKLMPEKDLAEYFNVSRTTIREALNNMEKKSLIKKRKSRNRKVFSIDELGMVYASKTNVRISVAAITAKIAASTHSLQFFFLCFLTPSAPINFGSSLIAR